MATIIFSNRLQQEYEHLFNSCVIREDRMKGVDDLVKLLCINKSRYENVGMKTGIPWWFVAVVHNMEASLQFTRHLHNGDPLGKRTVQVPAGRPKTGNPPFTWEESAEDALSLKGLDAKTDWSLAGSLYQLERYNGWGYRLHHQHVLSPYLWSFSNHYKSGKYVADGTWSDIAVSKQCGGAVLLRRMAEKNHIEFPDQPAPSLQASALIPKYSTKKSSNLLLIEQVENLQRWLNTFAGIFVKVDGVPGEFTSNAYKKVVGSYLPGDPRRG